MGDSVAAPNRYFKVNYKELDDKGAAALKENKFQEALTIYDQGVRLIPAISNPVDKYQMTLRAYTGRGTALAGLKEYEAANDDFQEAFKQDPNYLPALVARGQASAATVFMAAGSRIPSPSLPDDSPARRV